MHIRRFSRGCRSAALAGLGIMSIAAAKAFEFAPSQPKPELVSRFLASLSQSAPSSMKSAVVPVVGCAADGQSGPISPSGLPKGVTIQAAPGQAERLAYFYAEPTGGVLAPRGWKCVGTYGSDGHTLTVVPPEANQILRRLPEGKITGPVVMLKGSFGGTSGRFEVAAVAARVFPVARKFAESVRDEGIEFAEPGGIVFAPWPRDTINRLSDRVIAYLTPAREQGLGTNDNVTPSQDGAVLGVAFLSEDLDGPDLTVLHVRLGKYAELYPTIAVNALPQDYVEPRRGNDQPH